MTDNPTARVGPEELTAFLRGELSSERRQEVARRISESDDDYAVFLDTVQIAASVDDNVLPPVARGEPRSPDSRWVVGIAAALLISGGIWIVTNREPNAISSSWYRMLEAAAPLDEIRVSTPAGGPRSFANSRNDDVRSLQLGVAHMDLEVSLRQGDRILATLACARIYEATDGSQSVQGFCELVTDAGALQSMWSRIPLPTSVYPSLDRVSYDTGLWIEASRLAASAEAAGFFSQAHFRRKFAEVRRTNTSPALDQEYVNVSKALSESDIDWRALERALGDILFLLSE